MNSSRTRWYGPTDLPTHPIFNLLVVLGALTVYKTRKKWFQRLLIRQCHPPCAMAGYHTHHLSLLGKAHYVWRYRVFSTFVPDFRPQPVAGEKWYPEYANAWEEQYPDVPCRSCWVRTEEAGETVWVWVTDTPGFDRAWFDTQGWQFPAKWITAESLQFYTIGHDSLSAIVNIKPLEAENV